MGKVDSYAASWLYPVIEQMAPETLGSGKSVFFTFSIFVTIVLSFDGLNMKTDNN